MFATTPKLRTAIAMVIAAFSVAVATGPMLTAAQAAPVIGGGALGGFSSLKDKQLTCDNLQTLFGYDVDSGNVSAANQDYDTAHNAGCRWAPDR